MLKLWEMLKYPLYCLVKWVDGSVYTYKYCFYKQIKVETVVPCTWNLINCYIVAVQIVSQFMLM